jgi:hypothetical protein
MSGFRVPKVLALRPLDNPEMTSSSRRRFS